MAHTTPAHIWLYRAAYLLLAVALIFVAMIPLKATPPTWIARSLPQLWVAPDLLLALTFSWVVRRPDYVPAILIAAVMFLTDLLFGRPPGLWTAMVLLGSELLRARHDDLRDVVFVIEWAAVAIVMILTVTAYRLILVIMLPEHAQITLAATQLAFTVALYPLVVGFCYWVLSVRRAAPGQVDALGRAI